MSRLKPENALLLIVDIQERLVNAVDNSDVAKSAKMLLQSANILNIPVLITEQYPKGLGSTEVSLQQEYTDNVCVLEKTSFSVLGENSIKEKLQSYSKKQIVVCGIEAHVCVYQSVVELLEEGYEVFVVKNACASRKPADFEVGMDLMRQNGARITGCETVLFEWLQSSKNPHFKEVQKLII